MRVIFSAGFEERKERGCKRENKESFLKKIGGRRRELIAIWKNILRK